MIVKHRYFHFYLSIILWSWFLWNMFISRQKKSKIFPLVGIMQLGKSDCKKKKFVPVKYGLGYSLHCFFSLFPIICLFFLIIVFHHHCFLRIVNDCSIMQEDRGGHQCVIEQCPNQWDYMCETLGGLWVCARQCGFYGTVTTACVCMCGLDNSVNQNSRIMILIKERNSDINVCLKMGNHCF